VERREHPELGLVRGFSSGFIKLHDSPPVRPHCVKELGHKFPVVLKLRDIIANLLIEAGDERTEEPVPLGLVPEGGVVIRDDVRGHQQRVDVGETGIEVTIGG